MAQKPEPVLTSLPEAPQGTMVAAMAPKKGQKRRRTRSHNSSPSPGRGFFVPGFDTNSAGFKMMSLTELMDAAKGVSNMYMAHEIAIDKDFRVESLKKKETVLEAEVKSVVHRVFWDILKAELDEDPPIYTMALSMLKEIRDDLIDMLLPHQNRIRAEIMEKLDIDLIGQQANNGTLDVSSYSGYVLDLMAKLCAPVRDDEIAELRTKTEVVPLFQGIRVTMENMELDMANFVVQQMRPVILTHSVDYEKAKFSEFLKTQVDGLMLTREWLQRHAPPEEESRDPKYHKLMINRVMTDAFVELLEWDDYFGIPETLVMDLKRIVALRDAVERMSVSTAVILLAFSNVNGFIIPAHAQKLKETMKEKIDVLLENFYEDADLISILPSIALQIIKDVNDYLASNNKDSLPESTVKTLKDQIPELEDPNHRIRDLVQRRIIEFNKQAINPSRSGNIQVPPGLTLCQRELAKIVNGFIRLVTYNRTVFGEYYVDIVENHVLFKEPAGTRPANDPK